jgi:hypothetical protein
MEDELEKLSGRVKGSELYDPSLLKRVCGKCGDVYEKPDNTPWGRWLKRSYCSKACWWAHRPERTKSRATGRSSNG